MALPRRVERVESEIQKEVSKIFLLEIKEEGIGLVTFTGVKICKDLSFARIYYTVYGDAKEREKADSVLKMLDYDFGEPPHSIIFPGKLHFMEAEALVVLAGAPEKVREMVE